MERFEVGQKVHAGDIYTPDWDHGVILVLNGSGSAAVAWSGGTRTNIAVGMLTPYDGVDFWPEDDDLDEQA